ncbi:hypothetical protein FisN_3Lh137 [Fistulifera solaris]|uniref:Peptidyl-prolyl cis-trans isomerase n=1 Tax=Fistulifera solaris TaxID=1519565 RepID=A0A1Z5JHU0_FISSO|nr:hypothetical protein FisN_3Lh137 [Fistulifera solaris]|eukprot:GAX13569.1 hypothetical protein FisN_3Lh137 [Fistulifera solaris]
MQKPPQQMKRRIRRSRATGGSYIRLLKVIAWMTALLAFCALLFEMDHFRTKRQYRIKSGSTPEKLLLRQQEQHLRHTSEKTDDTGGTDDTVVTKHPPRLVMTLAGLTGESDPHNVIIEVRPDWAPIGAAHLLELVEAQFYDDCRFFRVLPNFVVQFGINGNPSIQLEWKTKVLQDDPVKESNKRGTLTFATSGKNTRTTQLFINLNDNAALDQQGFAPIGEVIEGMEYIDKISSNYRERPNQGQIVNKGNAYLLQEFPELSYITSMRLQKADDAILSES